MKNDRGFSNSCLMFSFVFILAASSNAHAAEEDYIARAVSVNGKVLMRGEGTGNAQMTFLKAGDKLYKGTILNTGSTGSVKLLMTDRTILDLGPSSLFKMNEYQLKAGAVGDRKVDMSLDYGTVRASVNEKITTDKGKFTIRTKAATMGVRGTEFVVNAGLPAKDSAGASAQPPKTSLTVMHGKVEVKDTNSPGAKPVAVTPGFQFAKSGDGPSSVAKLQAAEIAQVKAEAFQKDMTFMQAVSFDAGESKRENGTQANGDGGPNQGGKQTVENIGMNVETQANDQSVEKPTIADLNLPGVFNPDVPQIRPIDQLNGRLVNLRVIIKSQ